MSKVKNIPGENWGVCGKMNTGKTFVTLEIAVQIQQTSGKPIIAYDHASNDSYDGFEYEITLDQLEDVLLEPYKSYRVIDPSQNYDQFLYLATHEIRDSVLILDDCGNYLSGGMNDIQMAFLTASKNNRNDVFFQFHSFKDVGPKVLRNLQMVIIKEQAISSFPDGLPCVENVERLHAEVVAENNQRDPEELWSYRIYDLYRDIVYWENARGILEQEPGRTYFNKSKSRK